jgi:protein-S-isoprenylcysteine O-methyltransferase Ste14
MSTTKEAVLNKGLRWSVWGVYCLIVFEILFMISPFALYYYSVYSIPLNWLQENAVTAWLTLYVLPHFTYTGSFESNFLLAVAWPLILLGLGMFFFGFAQIYWAKFTGNRTVASGLYRHVRHPQYVALAIVGLGTTIYWSRFIVVMAYVSMLFLYYFLARYEERLCVAKFGPTYLDYQSRTGMFVPKSWLEWIPRVRALELPRSRYKRYSLLALSYVIVMSSAIGVAVLLKQHVVNRMTIHASDGLTLVALASTTDANMQAVHSLVTADPRYRRMRPEHDSPSVLGYVAPSSWAVPELGLRPQAPRDADRSGIEEILRPTVHGNSLTFDETRWTVLLTEPVVVGNQNPAHGRELLHKLMTYIPRLELALDVEAGAVVSVSEHPSESGWSGIPVPVY